MRAHLDQQVRQSVEDTLNGLLDAEADELCGAGRYERSAERRDKRAGHYSRKLHIKAGEVNLKVPKLRTLKFETAIIERYRRREDSVEEALIQMYLAGVSVRKVEDITETLWGTRVSPSSLSDLNKKVYKRIDAWRNRPLEGDVPYVYLDGLYLKRCFGGEVRNISILVAIGVDADGYRTVLGVEEGAKEDLASWQSFLRHLKKRGLSGVRLFVSDKCLGLLEALNEVFPEGRHQWCTVHFYRNVFTKVPSKKVKDVAAMLKAVHAQEDLAAARAKGEDVVEKLKGMKLRDAAQLVSAGLEATLSYYAFPREHWTRLRTNNPLERVIREIKRRTKVVGTFPDGQSALMLSAARLRYVAGSRWATKRYLSMDRLYEQEKDGRTATASA